MDNRGKKAGGGSPEELPDEELINLYNKGDSKALDTLVERYKRPLYSFLWRMTRSESEADEVFQDTWMKVIQKAADFKMDRFKGWIFKIAHNLVIDRSRTKGRTISLDAPVGDDGDDCSLADFFEDGKTLRPDQRAHHRDIRRAIEKALDQLPKEQSSVFVMRMELDMTFREIAELQGIPLNTTLARMQYALAKLRNLLKEHDGGGSVV